MCIGPRSITKEELEALQAKQAEVRENQNAKLALLSEKEDALEKKEAVLQVGEGALMF